MWNTELKPKLVRKEINFFINVTMATSKIKKKSEGFFDAETMTEHNYICVKVMTYD